ncbi:MAG: hypothetical protein JXB36_15890 [Gammaproteobacteria bacterium]|nr:hypothetical protein [Gammaproteobacteria bacterium]
MSNSPLCRTWRAPALAALGALAITASAQQPAQTEAPPLYQVEVIVFAYNDADPNEELFRPKTVAAPRQMPALGPAVRPEARPERGSGADARRGSRSDADAPAPGPEAELEEFDFEPLTAPDLADRIAAAAAAAEAADAVGANAAGAGAAGAAGGGTPETAPGGAADAGLGAAAGGDSGGGPAEDGGPGGGGASGVTAQGVPGGAGGPGAPGGADAGAGVDPADPNAAVFGERRGPGTPFRFRIVERDALQMRGTYDRLQQIDAYTPLLHGGWIQEGLPEAAARPFDLGYLGTFNPLGTIRLHVSRFLHLTLDLDYRPTPVQPAARLPSGDDGSAYGLSELALRPWLPLETGRRIRSGEVNYFDHPYFGVLIMVTPYEPEILRDDAEGPAA